MHSRVGTFTVQDTDSPGIPGLHAEALPLLRPALTTRGQNTSRRLSKTSQLALHQLELLKSIFY